MINNNNNNNDINNNNNNNNNNSNNDNDEISLAMRQPHPQVVFRLVLSRNYKYTVAKIVKSKKS